MATQEIKLPFEISSIDDENAVFKKIISKSGKSPKTIKDIKAQLPTTTIQYMSDEDFGRLKEIEAKLLVELKKKKIEKNDSLLKLIMRFLEI
jgi:hypothetical protein